VIICACVILAPQVQVTPDPSADEPQLPQQPSQPQQSQNPQSYQQSSLERDGGAGDDSAPNTMRHTTRFSMPNGHSYEVNFTTHVFQPGAHMITSIIIVTSCSEISASFSSGRVAI
jgi:hypothetical protein